METKTTSQPGSSASLSASFAPINPKPAVFTESFIRISLTEEFREKRQSGEFSNIEMYRVKPESLLYTDSLATGKKNVNIIPGDSIIIDKSSSIKTGDIVLLEYNFVARVHHGSEYLISKLIGRTDSHIILLHGDNTVKEYYVPLSEVIKLNKVTQVIKLVKV